MSLEEMSKLWAETPLELEKELTMPSELCQTFNDVEEMLFHG